MARESQGLQVLLIVFVMLTVVLGVTTYLYNKKADEATNAAKAADAAKLEVEKAKQDVQNDRDRLKRFIGFPPESSSEDVEKQFTQDTQTYGNAKAEGDKPVAGPDAIPYKSMVETLYKTVQDRNADLIKSRADYLELQTNYKSLEAKNDDKVAAYTKNYGDLDAQIKKIAEDYTVGLKNSAEQTQALTGKIEEIKKKATAEMTAADEAVVQAKKQRAATELEVKDLSHKLKQVDKQEMDVPSGEITWVSLPNKMVWINRGRADALQRQTKFAVYAADATVGGKGVKKGTVEVVRVDSDHSAQARILDDKLADPILAGDKVFTPLWSPGQRNHFALTGIMNLDGDGRNQLNVVRGMISESGGEVDCWLDEQGHKQGQMTASTRFIVVGDPPDKSTTEFKKNHAEILGEADRYQARTLMLSDFKQQMGYQKSSSVEHYGPSLPSPTKPAPGRPKAAAASDAGAN